MNGFLCVCFAACVTLCFGAQCHGPQDTRVYTFAFGKYLKPYEFINEDGDFMGFFSDIVRRVCATACKECAFIVYEEAAMCWNPHTMQGIGLNNRYWDVCAGWVVTKQRQQVYSQFGTFNNERTTALFVRQDETIQIFDPDNHKIGIRLNFRTSEMCLKRKYGWEAKKVFYYRDWPEIMEKVLDGTVDVGFTDEGDAIARGGLRKISPSTQCALKGPGLMMRKDVAPDYAWFVPALKTVMASTYYKWICNIAKRAYGGDPFCITPP